MRVISEKLLYFILKTFWRHRREEFKNISDSSLGGGGGGHFHSKVIGMLVVVFRG